MKQVFPEPEYQAAAARAGASDWHAEEKIDPQQMRPLLGIEFGCRTSVVYVPADPPQDPRPSLSCLWELSRPGRGEKYSRVVQAEIDAGLSLGINVLAYATNRELKPKRRSQPTRPQRPADRLERGKLYVATLRHPGGCNAAPRAVANLMDAAADELKLRTHVRDELLDITDDVAVRLSPGVHARADRLSPDRRRAAAAAAVHRTRRDVVCRLDLRQPGVYRVVPPRNGGDLSRSKLERIPADDPLLSKTYGGFDLQTVSRRDPRRRLARAAAGSHGPQSSARPGGHQVWRPLGRDLLAVRPELRLESTIRWSAAATPARTPRGSA